MKHPTAQRAGADPTKDLGGFVVAFVLEDHQFDDLTVDLRQFAQRNGEYGIGFLATKRRLDRLVVGVRSGDQRLRVRRFLKVR